MKLNLGCGKHKLDGYLNVDISGNPDLIFDLETFPYPWEDNSITEIKMTHVLEHLCESKKDFKKMIQELYRICKNSATIDIVVPHPKSDNFLNDFTHVRPITPDGLIMLSKKFNLECIEKKYSNSTFGLDWDVDFELLEVNLIPFPEWRNCQFDITNSVKSNWNVISDICIKMKCIKG
jgi:predicted SAM-dependent methyltransferase